ncbi:MAG TPA: hypothetical protein DCE11_08855 [Ruminiclostridium sp.]|nr:hypothetical protein [Ruminiclostridium sp.]
MNQCNFKAEMDYLRSSLMKNKQREQDRIFCSLLYEKTNTDQLIGRLEYLGVQFTSNKFQIALIEIETDTMDSEEPEYKYLLFLYCLDSVRNHLAKYANCYTFPDMTGKIAKSWRCQALILPGQ